MVDFLLTLGLTAADARADNDNALRFACLTGNLAIVERLLGLGLTAEDARAGNNHALRLACSRKFGPCPNLHGHLSVVERLLRLGLTADDIRMDDGRTYENALIAACNQNYRAVVCALAAHHGGAVAPSGELHTRTLEQIIRAPAESSRRAKTRRAAARAAASWPSKFGPCPNLQSHAEVLTRLSPEDSAAWAELYAEATFAGYGSLRSAD